MQSFPIQEELGDGIGSPEIEKKLLHTADKTHYALLKRYSRSNRFEMTNAEVALWSQIRGNQLGVRFRRQHIIGDYIVDFICLRLKFIIEVDGEYHNTKEKQEFDKLRDSSLRDEGYTILRFTNNEVIGNIDTVITCIQHKIQQIAEQANEAGASPL